MLAQIKAWVARPGRDARGASASASPATPATCSRSRSRADVEHRRDRRAHDGARVKFFGDVDVICDIGGQDIKVLFMAERRRRRTSGCRTSARPATACCCRRWPISSACRSPSTPTSRSRRALAPKFSYGCAVFLDADRVNFQKEGYAKEELLAGLAHGAAEERLAVRRADSAHGRARPRVRAPGRHAEQPRRASRRRSTTSRSACPNAEVYVHPHSGRGRRDRRRVRDAARRRAPRHVDVRRPRCGDRPRRTRRRNDESTRCHFCPNNCSRTFIDTKTLDGRTSRYISGLLLREGHGRDRWTR